MSDLKGRARKALMLYSGCSEDRAGTLVEAVAAVAQTSALEVITGAEPVAPSISEQRVARLYKLSCVPGVGKLAVPEIEGLFRITEGQAKSLDRTFRARFPNMVEDALDALLKKLVPESEGVEKVDGWKLTFTDPELQRHAKRRLDRAGIFEHVVADQSLVLKFPKKAKDADGKDADPLATLGIPEPAKKK